MIDPDIVAKASPEYRDMYEELLRLAAEMEREEEEEELAEPLDDRDGVY